MAAYYNEFDPNAAAWLRELIRRGLIAPGEVDERDLWDVHPDDLGGFEQVHLCAGIGVWSYALRQAGVPDDWPCWTGSFPCQPFSAAGKGAGFADERHLWPAGYHLIEVHRPAVIFGEQVASKDAEPWLDLVQDDLEALGYAVGAVPFPAAGVGAPHIRDRLYWVADANGSVAQQPARPGGRTPSSVERARPLGQSQRRSDAGSLADTESERPKGRPIGDAHHPQGRLDAEPSDGRDTSLRLGAASGLADADGRHSGAERQQRSGKQRQQPQNGGAGGVGHSELLLPRRNTGAGPAAQGRDRSGHIGDDARSSGPDAAPGPLNGLWRDADWLLCRDGKWRPVEPGAFPLAHGASSRVGRLRGYGNAICAPAAQAFIEAYLDTKTIDA